jgi:hypothetical protein
MAKQIIVTCSKGKVVIKTTGYAGAECLKATAQLERDLGIEKESDVKTPEYYQTATEVTRVKQ